MPKGKSKHSTKIWLDDQLMKKNFRPVNKMLELFDNTGDDNIKFKILETIWDRLYPKMRPVDAEGNAEDSTTNILSVPLTLEERFALIEKARGGK